MMAVAVVVAVAVAVAVANVLVELSIADQIMDHAVRAMQGESTLKTHPVDYLDLAVQLYA
jgi:hypothetical protein